MLGLFRKIIINVGCGGIDLFVFVVVDFFVDGMNGIKLGLVDKDWSVFVMLSFYVVFKVEFGV